MKLNLLKALLIAILLPIIAVAQTKQTIELKDYGLNATLTNNNAFEVEKIKQDESDFKTVEVKVYFTNSNRLTITELKKPLSVPVYLKAGRQALASKNKTVTLKAIVNSGNAILIERTYKDDGRKIYKCMWGVILKGKHYLVDSDEVDDVETCKKLLEVAKSLKIQ